MAVPRTWRTALPPRGRAADAAVACGVGLVVVAGTLLAERLRGGVLGPVGWLVVLAGCAALYPRRRHPTAVAAATLAACCLHYALGEVDGPLLLTFVVALYTAAAQGRPVGAVATGAAALAGVGLGELDSPSRHLDDVSVFLLTGWLVAVIAVGWVTRTQAAYRREAERRAAAAELGREEEARRRATEERLRIARELHDVLGHNISLINVQASAALHRLDADPAQARGALDAIKRVSGQALRELRTTLGVLRQVDEPSPTAPPASLAGLGELVDHASAAGLRVRTEIEGEPRPVPPEVDLAAYRIVQEALTNVTRHAAASSAVVRIRYGEQDVRVEVDDDGRGGPAVVPGNGIGGMGERARALGGEFDAGGRPGGGFRVRARLPLAGVP